MNFQMNPHHRSIVSYYRFLEEFKRHYVTHEGATSTAFQTLLQEIARERGWTLIPQQRRSAVNNSKRTIAPDGTLRDQFGLVHGYWEAKDSRDELATEIRTKIQAGYPLNNTIFEDTQSAVLFQNGKEIFRADLQQSTHLADLLTLFFNYAEPNIEQFEQAVAEFAERVPELARVLVERVQQAHRDNRKFQQAFDTFYALCKKSLNPNLSVAAVDEMLVQHLLTVRLITTVFDNPFFLRRNVIAREVETVIDALISKAFDPRQFLAGLDRFYVAIENAGRTIIDWSEKQEFLNKIYERFFQGYSVKVADTHGIVYTPQPIVDFMCASVVEVLQKEFGKRLGDPDVVILDPATGTGNFVVNLLQRIPARDVEDTYKHRLFANEVMLMPYYIASLNIEHKYYELTGTYEPFEGICFVDTLDLTERQQLTFDFMSEENTERVARQRAAPITVIIGNPPYNVGQLNENDNNKNRRYDDHEKAVDRRVRDTYAKASKATNKNALSDMYVKFFRWATDRLGDRDGVICYVTNNSFVDQIALDGMRQSLREDFTAIYHIDLHGNVRQNPKLSGTTHNVFGIQVGVGITIAIRNHLHSERTIYYQRVEESWRKEQKYQWLIQNQHIYGVEWQRLFPNIKNTWLVPENADIYNLFLPMGSKEAKAGKAGAETVLFDTFSIGLTTSRDNIVFDFHIDTLEKRIKQFINDYNLEVYRYQNSDKSVSIDDFVSYEKIKWSRDLKADLKRGRTVKFLQENIRFSMYRPFCKMWYYFDKILNQDIGRWATFLPTPQTDNENSVICVSGPGNDVYRIGITKHIVEYKYANSANGGTQCFPFYVYDEDGTNRRENITDWALETFRAHYGDPAISKWDIFYYVYALLHHPTYRTRYADNLKRELPRIPMLRVTGKEGSKLASPFHLLSTAGKDLADLHLNYEQAKPYHLDWIETASPVHTRVEKMRLSKDKQSLVVNETLTLHGIPLEAFKYRLGNRSALEWVVDQYRVTKDTRSGIVSDPNRADDRHYIVNLVEKVIAISLRTVEIVGDIERNTVIEGVL